MSPIAQPAPSPAFAMVVRSPRVSIGLPVHNGERYLRVALDSLLQQTFADFEIVLGDNASTDGTGAICEEYARRDTRVCYQRHRSNQGAAYNFNYVLGAARGEYFRWAAHDDTVAPEFLARTLEVLDRDRSAVLCQSRVLFIDAEGKPIAAYEGAPTQTAGERPHRRFAELVLRDHKCIDIFGLMRTETLRRTPGIASYAGSDRVLLAELALRGRFLRVPELLFFSRSHAGQSINALPGLHLRAAWFDPSRAGKRALPHWRLFAEYARAIGRAPLPPRERALCALHLLRWPLVDWNWARMGRDFLTAAGIEAWPPRKKPIDSTAGACEPATRLPSEKAGRR